jgi:hypothetical protein
MVMQNTARVFNKRNDRLTFDLKGSTYKRKVVVGSRFWRECLNYKSVMKDLNYLEINRDLNGTLMNISKEQFDEI